MENILCTRRRVRDMSAGRVHGHVLQYGDRLGGILFIRQHEIRITMDNVPEQLEYTILRPGYLQLLGRFKHHQSSERIFRVRIS